MVREYAITPGVFAADTYESPVVADLRLSLLKDGLLNAGIVRDLHDGEWLSGLLKAENRDNLHHRGKELLKKLSQQGRLRTAAKVADRPPIGDDEWCREALRSSQEQLLDGTVTTPQCKRLGEFGGNDEIASIEKLDSASWWGARSSVELRRTTSDYLEALRVILRQSKSLMFIDPHLDPTSARYGQFFQLLQQCQHCPEPPLIELHRVAYLGSGPNRTFLTAAELERMFNCGLGEKLRGSNLRIEVFVWDDAHDRFLISNLLGINMPNGFDINSGNPTVTRWGRLEREDRDSVQREFDEMSTKHTLIHRFSVQC